MVHLGHHLDLVICVAIFAVGLPFITTACSIDSSMERSFSHPPMAMVFLAGFQVVQLSFRWTAPFLEFLIWPSWGDPWIFGNRSIQNVQSIDIHGLTIFSLELPLRRPVAIEYQLMGFTNGVASDISIGIDARLSNSMRVDLSLLARDSIRDSPHNLKGL